MTRKETEGLWTYFLDIEFQVGETNVYEKQ